MNLNKLGKTKAVNSNLLKQPAFKMDFLKAGLSTP